MEKQKLVKNLTGNLRKTKTILQYVVDLFQCRLV